MGTNNLTTIGASIVKAVGTQLDQYFTAISGVFVPRNASGVPEDKTQDLGSSSTAWKDGYIGNILISGNTLSSTDANGNINITPDGVGRTITGRQLGTQVIDAVAGVYTINVEYTATDADLFICFWGVNTGGIPEISILTGATIGASATLALAQAIVVSNTTGFVSAMVKKGYKWKAYTNGVTAYGISTTAIS